MTISSLGDYQVVASRNSKNGDLVVTGLSMTGDNALVRTQLLVEIMIALLGATAAALAGRAMVRSSLAPLERIEDGDDDPVDRGEDPFSGLLPGDHVEGCSHQVG